MVLADTTYTQNASSTTGGANLNLVGSDSTTDTIKFAEGVGIDIVQTDANTITTLLNATLDDLSNVDNTTTAPVAGHQFYYNGTNWVNSPTVDSANLNRFSRTVSGTSSNVVIELSRNRADAARSVDGGPWLGLGYVGTDNTQATSAQNAIRSLYKADGNHAIQITQHAGSYAAPSVVAQIARGNTFINTTSGVAALFLSDSIARIGGTTTNITNSANTTTYATFGATVGSINQDTFTVKNTAGTTTYANFTSTGHTLSAGGLHTFTRTTTGTPGSSESRPSLNIQLTRTDQATPNNGDGTSFRTRVAGSNGTFYTLSDLGSSYATNGNTSWNLNLANGDQTTGSFSGLPIISASISSTTIRAGTPSGTPGASTANDVAILAPGNNTLKADNFTLTDYAGTALVGSKISYNRVYGQFEYNTTVTPAAINTAYVFPLGTAATNNIATVGSTSRLIAGAAGTYNLQFSVQVDNADNGNDHIAYIWLRKNGTDVVGSTGRVTVAKGVGTISGWNYLVTSANTTDYWEIAYAVEDLNLTFPYYAATAFAPSTASVITTLTPVGA